jgi:hypothetical protein
MVYEVEAVSSLSSDGSITPLMNTTNIETGELAKDPQMREIASQLSRWVDNARSAAHRTSMFDRGMFTPPDNPYDEMRTARNAVKYDSTVAGIVDTTEALAFDGVKWESPDADEADVFNQLAIDQNLDQVVRNMWREEFTYGQFVCAKLWGWREYTVRGQTSNGNKKKKKIRIWAPLQLRLLDPAKIVPVGIGPLAGENLAWQATKGEIGYYQSAYTGEVIDPVMLAFFTGTYRPGFDEQAELAQIKVNASNLLAINSELVFRHTLTKPDYQRFPDVPLKSLFSVLDLKRQLMSSDRAQLIGSANYILLIRKGLVNEPAQPEEIANLRENYNFIAKMPVIISDHRLSIDIIAPKTDFVLNADKYDLLDQRIMQRLLGTLSISGKGQRNETQETISFAVARNMENRRHMLKRALEIQIARAVVEHPKNKGIFDHEPNLVYTPRNLALSLAPSYLQSLMALRTQREISRETILEYFGLDEETEALRIGIEAEMFDHIFKTEIPYTGGQPNEGADPGLDKKAQKDEGLGMQLTVGPDGTVKALPKDGDKGTAPGSSSTPPGQTKDGANKKGSASQPASGRPSDGRTRTGPNGTPEAPSVSGRRGGRPVGGGQSKNSPAAQAKPRTRNGNPSTGGR